MPMPLGKLVTSTGPEKHTMIRGFTLNPSNWFKSCLLMQSAEVDKIVQPVGSGRLTCTPVFWVLVLMVRALAGNGPIEEEDGWNKTVVLPHHSGSGIKRRTRRTFTMFSPTRAYYVNDLTCQPLSNHQTTVRVNHARQRFCISFELN